MTFLTAFALRRPTVTLLAIIIVLASGVLSYRSMQVELFPQIEFPLVTVFASYPSADPEAVVRDVTDPIERAISGADGLETVQSSPPKATLWSLPHSSTALTWPQPKLLLRMPLMA